MTVNTVSEVQTTQKEPESERLIFTFKVNQVIWLLLSIFEALLALRFVLKLIGAKPTPRWPRLFMFSAALCGCGFSSFDRDTRSRRHGPEVSTLIAMLVYGLIAWAVERIIFVTFYRPRGPITRIYKRDESNFYIPLITHPQKIAFKS